MSPEMIHWQLDVIEALGIDHPIANAWISSAYDELEYLRLRRQIEELGASERLLDMIDIAATVSMARELAELSPEQMAALNDAVPS